MRPPLLLDLFCGAGGAGAGYHFAGFLVVGVDAKPQRRYPYTFVQADAFDYLASNGHRFDAIHASPPCQAYSALAGLSSGSYPRLIVPLRTALVATGKPYVIENVVGAPLFNPVRLCGSSFELGVRRHRLFETSWPVMFPPQCAHYLQPDPVDVTGQGTRGTAARVGGSVRRMPRSAAHAREAMGIDWMTRVELSQAIPPAYTYWLGQQLRQHLARQRLAVVA